MSPRSTGWASSTVARTERAPRSPSHRRGADARAEGEVGVLLRRAVSSSARGQVGDPDRAAARSPSSSSPAATTSFISRSTSLRCEICWASGRCSATPSTRHRRPARDQPGRLAQVAGGEPVAQHRGHPLEDDPRALAGRAAVLGERRQVLEPADGVDHPSGRVVGRRVERAPRGQHEQRPVEPLADARAAPRRCRRRGCRRRATAALRASRPQAEAVAVALGDRDEAGVGARGPP